MRNIIVASLSLAVLTCAALAADWPNFLGPNANSVSPETNLAKSFPTDGPKVLWKADTHAGFGGAAVKDGKVYVLDRIDDKQDVLLCLDLKDGKELWHYAYDAPGTVPYPGSRSTPAVDDKYVFAIGPVGQISCLSVDQKDKEAKPLWTKDLVKDFGGKLPGWKSAGSPVIYKDTLIIAPQSKTVGVAALDKKTGDVVWKSGPVGSMNYCTPVVMTIGDVPQVVMETGDGVAGVKIGTGEMLWQYDGYKVKTAACPSPIDCSQGRIFMTGGYGAGSCMIQVAKEGDKFAAKELWKTAEVGSHIQNPVFWKECIYLNNDDKGGGLVCLGLDGKVKWRSKEKFDKGNLVIADGVIYITEGKSSKGSKAAVKIVAADPAGYKELASGGVMEGEMVWAPMALSDGKLILRDQKQIKCVDISGK